MGKFAPNQPFSPDGRDLAKLAAWEAQALGPFGMRNLPCREGHASFQGVGSLLQGSPRETADKPTRWSYFGKPMRVQESVHQTAW